jgi:osmotically-inducible protein OsmY
MRKTEVGTMRKLIRIGLAVFVLVVGGLALFSYWNGQSATDRTELLPQGTTGSAGTIDIAKARERGADVAGKAAAATARVEESVAEAALTTKIKAKMALDDHVRARAIDVTTMGTTVRLEGKVRSNEERERAVTLARETAGVTHVIDQLVIAR